MHYIDVITILHGMSLSVMVQTTASMMGTYCYSGVLRTKFICR